MHLFNHSYLPDDIIESIGERIQSAFEHSHRTILFVHTDKLNNQRAVTGLAYKRAPAPFEEFAAVGLESLVVLTLPQEKNFRYPFFSRYVDEVPGIDIGSLDDDILLVLAHELRHIDQFWRNQIRSEADRHWSEVDAERYAVATLIKHRSKAKKAA